MKYALLQLAINRTLIIVIGLFCLTLSANLSPIPKPGDAQVFPIFQGENKKYTYIQSLNPLIHMWEVWDTKWYVSIADSGYSTQTQPYATIDNKGFLPVYPILLNIFSTLLFAGNTALAGIFISNAFLIASLYFIIQLVKNEPKFKENISIADVSLYTILFPTSYYLSAVYPESLFLFLSILVFYFLQKKKLVLASLMFSIACLTKTFGIFLIIPILFYIYTQKEHIKIQTICKSIAACMFLPIAYLIAMFRISGDPFAYIHIQETFFRHEWAEPLGIILTELFVGNPFSLWHIAFITFGITLLILVRKKLPLPYLVYGFAYILFTPTTGVLEGSSRYMASLLVIPISLSLLIKKQEVKNTIFIVFSFIQGFALFWWIIGSGFTS